MTTGRGSGPWPSADANGGNREFDTDDLVYRLLTLLDMFAVAALASTVPHALHGG